MMQIGRKGLELIKSFEGCRLEAYICPAGVPTIGYGHTHGVRLGQIISQKQADDLLFEDLDQFVKAVNRLVIVPLNQNQFDALVSFVFNIGIVAFASSTLLRLLNQQAYNGAADQFKRWNKGGGKVLKGLVRRRQAEEDLFRG